MNITPLHDAHAIESVSFGVEWRLPLPPTVMATLEAVYEATLKQCLPSKKPVQQVAFEFSVDGSNRIKQEESLGWTFERFAPDGRIDCSMMLASNTLAVTLHSYSNWQEVYAKAAEMMRPLLPLIAISSGGLTVFGLQYLDVFRIVGEPADFHADMLLRRDSELLPQSVFKQNSLWHAHHGYFTDLSDEPARRKLTVINTDLVDENGDRNLRILTMHRTMFSTPWLDVDQIYADGAFSLHTAMDDMHNDNKAVLCSLLNDPMLERIRLEVGKGAES